MNRHKSVQRAAMLACVLLSTPAWPCFLADSPLEATISFTNATTVEVVITGLVAQPGGVSSGSYCAVALGLTNLNTAVTGLSVIDVETDTPVPGFSFTANATTTSEFELFFPAPLWHGFFSPVSTDVPENTITDMAFTMTVPPGTTFLDLENELAAQNSVVGIAGGTAGGSVQNEEIETIAAVFAVPVCGNGITDQGEACDTNGNVGCVGGQTCAECTFCASVDLATACRVDTLKAIASNNKAKLKCYAAAKRNSQVVSAPCLASAKPNLTTYWSQLSPATCPLLASFPPSTMNGLVDTFDSSLNGGLVLGVPKCLAAKIKAGSVLATNKLKCYAKASARKVPVDPACLEKADVKAYNAVVKAGGACQGTPAMIAAITDDFVDDVRATVPPDQ